MWFPTPVAFLEQHRDGLATEEAACNLLPGNCLSPAGQALHWPCPAVTDDSVLQTAVLFTSRL